MVYAANDLRGREYLETNGRFFTKLPGLSADFKLIQPHMLVYMQPPPVYGGFALAMVVNSCYGGFAQSGGVVLLVP